MLRVTTAPPIPKVSRALRVGLDMDEKMIKLARERGQSITATYLLCASQGERLFRVAKSLSANAEAKPPSKDEVLRAEAIVGKLFY